MQQFKLAYANGARGIFDFGWFRKNKPVWLMGKAEQQQTQKAQSTLPPNPSNRLSGGKQIFEESHNGCQQFGCFSHIHFRTVAHYVSAALNGPGLQLRVPM